MVAIVEEGGGDKGEWADCQRVFAFCYITISVFVVT